MHISDIFAFLDEPSLQHYYLPHRALTVRQTRCVFRMKIASTILSACGSACVHVSYLNRSNITQMSYLHDDLFLALELSETETIDYRVTI